MTIDEKLGHVESALLKVRASRLGDETMHLSEKECFAIEAALEIAAGVCTLLKARS